MSEARLPRTRLAYLSLPVVESVTVVCNGKTNDDALKAWDKKIADEAAADAEEETTP